jgi:hypothetical protein
MSKSSKAVIEWRKRTKARIVESMGGKCSICGYSRCDEVLELHHLEPEKKKFGFSSIRANPKAWETIVTELRKCVLLCSNCHKEVEAGHAKVENKQYFIESYVDTKFFVRSQAKKYKEKVCIKCNQKFIPNTWNQRRCSSVC